MGDLLEACVEVTGSDARLTWVEPAFVLDHGLEPWTELPVWVPVDDVEMAALHTSDVSRALEWGLEIRPLRETVSDTWDWVRGIDAGGATPEPRAGIGVEPDKEAATLAAWATREQ